jgi:hypothetical protein
MQLYLPFLLDDIKKAHRAEDVIETKKELSFEEEMEIVENYATGENLNSLSSQCGLRKELFPAADLLSDAEMKTIVVAFHEMLDTWHISADLPDTLPLERAYSLLIGLLDEEACYFPGGTLHFDFCTGYAPDCELKEYCPCLQFWNEA